MSTSKPSSGEAVHLRGLTRRAALLLGLLVAIVVYPTMVVALPWTLSLLTPRIGWTEEGPSFGNLLGLFPVVVGLLGLVWVFSVMLAQLPRLPERIELEPGERLATATARVLVSRGPFAISRNPMFLSGLVTLLGWSVFYGSVLILVLSIVAWCFSNFATVPFEERALEARFAEEYRQYKARVPRWFGIARRG